MPHAVRLLSGAHISQALSVTLLIQYLTFPVTNYCETLLYFMVSYSNVKLLRLSLIADLGHAPKNALSQQPSNILASVGNSNADLEDSECVKKYALK